MQVEYGGVFVGSGRAIIDEGETGQKVGGCLARWATGLFFAKIISLL